MWIIFFLIFAIIIISIIGASFSNDKKSELPKNTDIRKSRQQWENEQYEKSIKLSKRDNYEIDKHIDELLNDNIPSKTEIKDYDRASKIASAKLEFPRRKQILEESIHLIKTTNNHETLNTRYETALEQYLWIQNTIDNKVPIYFKSNGYFPMELKIAYNLNLIRIAKKHIDNTISKLSTLKTSNAKDNCAVKAFEILEHYNDLLKVAGNQGESENELRKLKIRLEDFYSDLK